MGWFPLDGQSTLAYGMDNGPQAQARIDRNVVKGASHSFAAAYSTAEPSGNRELSSLVCWLADQDGGDALLVGPEAPPIGESSGAVDLIASGVPFLSADSALGPKRSVLQGRKAIAIWPSTPLLEVLSADVSALAILTRDLSTVSRWAASQPPGSVVKLYVDPERP